MKLFQPQQQLPGSLEGVKALGFHTFVPLATMYQKPRVSRLVAPLQTYIQRALELWTLKLAQQKVLGLGLRMYDLTGLEKGEPLVTHEQMTGYPGRFLPMALALPVLRPMHHPLTRGPVLKWGEWLMAGELTPRLKMRGVWKRRGLPAAEYKPTYPRKLLGQRRVPCLLTRPVECQGALQSEELLDVQREAGRRLDSVHEGLLFLKPWKCYWPRFWERLLEWTRL